MNHISNINFTYDNGNDILSKAGFVKETFRIPAVQAQSLVREIIRI